VGRPSPIYHAVRLSRDIGGAQIYLKREDLKNIRSYKIRGAFNKISSLTNDELAKGVVCASAGNHAQGFAFSCRYKKIKGLDPKSSASTNSATLAIRLQN